MKLYEVQAELYKCFDAETGEILDADQFDRLEGELNDKIEGIGCMIKNNALLISGLKEEKKRITERIQSLERKTESTKAFLDSILQGRKFETPRVRMTYRKTYSVDVADESLVPEDFVNIVEERKIDRMKIREALRNGADVKGCNLVEKNSLSIK